MPYIATRSMTAFGKKILPGGVVPMDALPEASARGLINLGRVRQTDEQITVGDTSEEITPETLRAEGPRHLGHGLWQLPNGEKVKGKVAALRAMQEE